MALDGGGSSIITSFDQFSCLAVSISSSLCPCVITSFYVLLSPCICYYLSVSSPSLWLLAFHCIHYSLPMSVVPSLCLLLLSLCCPLLFLCVLSVFWWFLFRCSIHYSLPVSFIPSFCQLFLPFVIISLRLLLCLCLCLLFLPFVS